MAATSRAVAADEGLGVRAPLLVRAAMNARDFREQHAAATCEVGERLAARLGASASVQRGLAEVNERWDGGGEPGGVQGTKLALPDRCVRVAAVSEHHVRLGGAAHAAQVIAARAGVELDPALCAPLIEDAAALFAPLGEPSVWELALAVPSERAWTSDVGLEGLAEAFADFVDLQCVHTLGHSRGVATLCDDAAKAAGVGEDERATLRVAALLHDLGRLSVPTGTWEKPGALTYAERERVRLHSHHTGRILQVAPTLAAIAPTRPAIAITVSSGSTERMRGRSVSVGGRWNP
ncbi:MAG: HD-GYP domain-containing protein [Sandaracinaceae bacterium]